MSAPPPSDGPDAAAAAARREFLTVRELADLLRIKDRKVYDLAAAGALPCTRVTGKLLFPEAAVRAWIARGSTGAPGAATSAPAIVLGSHDPLLEWALRQSRSGLATYFDGSLDGLARFVAGEGAAAGLHLPATDDRGWNVAAVADRGVEGAVLLGWARRRRGLVVRAAAADAIRSLADLPGRPVVPRQAGSGAHLLFERLLGAAGVDRGALTPTEVARSEGDAVSAVQRGDADAAFGLEALAAPAGLHFVPLVEESFDLLVSHRAWFEPPLQRFAAFCRGAEFRDRAAALAGYDVSGLFDVRWNG